MYKSTAARFLYYIRARVWLYSWYFVYLCKINALNDKERPIRLLAPL